MKKEPIKDHIEWLEQQPVFEGDNKEVFENADGSQYIPVGIVENLLDQLTDTHWSTENFISNSSTRVSNSNEKTSFIGGKIELTVTYGNITRTLTGVCDIKVSDLIAKTIHDKDNESYQATVLSNCLCNAAKKLGNRFGRSLNGRGVNKVEDKKEIPSISELDAQIEKVKSLIIEGGTYDNAIYLITVVYPNLKSNDTLNKLAESLKPKK
jgi:hypothetical protein